MKKPLLHSILSCFLSAALLFTGTICSIVPFPQYVHAEQVTTKIDLSNSDLWKIGHYSKDGSYSSWPSYVCVKNSFECVENATLTAKCGGNRRMEICVLDSDSKPLGVTVLTDGKSMTLPAGSNSFKLCMYNPSDYNLGYTTWKTKMFSDGREYSLTYSYEKSNDQPENTNSESENNQKDDTESIIDLSSSDLWKIGHYSKEGDYSSWPSYICVKQVFECSENDTMTASCGGNRRMEICVLDSSDKPLGVTVLRDGNSMTFPAGSKSFKLCMNNPSDYNLGYTTWKTKMFSDGRSYKLIYTKNNTGNDEPEEPSEEPSEKPSEEPSEEPSDPIEPSDVTAGDYTADQIISKIKVGWNLGNSLDSYYGKPNGTARFNMETVWGNPMVSQNLINKVSDVGFNTIRIPVSWYYHTGKDSDGNLYINEDWLKRVKEVVDYAYNNNMYVILNSHHDQPIFYAGTTDAKFEQVQKDVKLIWKQVAEYFKDYDDHLIFESFNEVDNVERSWNFSKKAAKQMNTMNQIFVDTVRETGGNNSKRVLMVPTLLDGYTSDFLNAFVLPKDTSDNRLLITIHNYASQIDQDVEPILTALEAFSKKSGAPIVIGECGSDSSFSPSEYRATNASNYFARAYAHGMRCIWWDNGSSYKIINRTNLSTNDSLIDAVINSKPYTNDSKTTYSSYSDFLYKTINQSTGNVVTDKYWGSTIINVNTKNGVDIPVGNKYMTLLLNISDDAVKQRIHYVYYFDKNDKLVGKVNSASGFTSKVLSIPSTAAYVRIGINNSYSKTSNANYQSYFDKGYISLTIGFLK